MQKINKQCKNLMEELKSQNEIDEKVQHKVINSYINGY